MVHPVSARDEDADRGQRDDLRIVFEIEPERTAIIAVVQPAGQLDRPAPVKERAVAGADVAEILAGRS